MTIKNVAMIGALYLDDEMSIDSARLRYFHLFCRNNGHPIAALSDLKVDVINLSDGRDFLKEKKKYDAVLICYIPAMAVKGASADSRCHSSFFQLSSNPTAQSWKSRLEGSNAKIILSFASKIEVNAQQLFGEEDPKFQHIGRKWTESIAERDTILSAVNSNTDTSGITLNASNVFSRLSRCGRDPYHYIDIQASMVADRHYMQQLPEIEFVPVSYKSYNCFRMAINQYGSGTSRTDPEVITRMLMR